MLLRKYQVFFSFSFCFPSSRIYMRFSFFFFCNHQEHQLNWLSFPRYKWMPQAILFDQTLWLHYGFNFIKKIFFCCFLTSEILTEFSLKKLFYDTKTKIRNFNNQFSGQQFFDRDDGFLDIIVTLKLTDKRENFCFPILIIEIQFFVIYFHQIILNFLFSQNAFPVLPTISSLNSKIRRNNFFLNVELIYILNFFAISLVVFDSFCFNLILSTTIGRTSYVAVARIKKKYNANGKTIKPSAGTNLILCFKWT